MKQHLTKRNLTITIVAGALITALIVAVMTALLLQQSRNVSPSNTKAAENTWAAPIKIPTSITTEHVTWAIRGVSRPTDGKTFILGVTSGSYQPLNSVLMMSAENPNDFITFNTGSKNMNTSPAPLRAVDPQPTITKDGTIYAAMSGYTSPDENTGVRNVYVQKISTTNVLGPILDTSTLLGGRSDFADIAYDNSSDSLYLVANMRGTSTWKILNYNPTTNAVLETKVVSAGSDIAKPHICVKPNGDVFIGGTANNKGGGMIQKVNGVWSSLANIFPEIYIGDVWLDCTNPDGNVYAVERYGNTFEFAKWTSANGWQKLSSDVIPGYGAYNAPAITSTPDGKIWIVFSGSHGSVEPAMFVVTTSDQGKTFSTPIAIIPGLNSGGTSLTYSRIQNKLYATSSNGDPRIAKFTSLQLAATTVTSTVAKTSTVVSTTTTQTKTVGQTTRVVTSTTPVTTTTRVTITQSSSGSGTSGGTDGESSFNEGKDTSNPGLPNTGVFEDTLLSIAIGFITIASGIVLYKRSKQSRKKIS